MDAQEQSRSYSIKSVTFGTDGVMRVEYEGQDGPYYMGTNLPKELTSEDYVWLFERCLLYLKGLNAHGR